jgi:diguanylate cyclase
MGILFKKKSEPLTDTNELNRRLSICTEANRFYLEASRRLLSFIRAFALEIEEIEAMKFKNELALLEEKFRKEGDTPSLRAAFHNQEKPIHSFILSQRAYLEEREKEFKGIIDLLTQAMAAANSDNQDFNRRISLKSERIERITFLDDIKLIKSELKTEIDQMRKTIHEKQVADDDRQSKLSTQINVLREELDRVRAESLRDKLTGIFNRAAFDATIHTLMDCGGARRTPFSFLMMDIDNFKHINDTYGHQIGDRVLIAFVDKCNEFIRKDDHLARFGGEEFTLILPGATLRNAVSKAKIICKGIASTYYTLSDIAPDAPLFSFTVSIGVAERKKEDTVVSLIDRADKALYIAKNRGKNCIASEKELS